MNNVTAEKFQEIQSGELGWWTHANFNPQIEWKFYLDVFESHLRPFKRVVDIGCGPVPIFMNPKIEASEVTAVDPLWEEYLKLDKYTQWHTRPVDHHYADVDQAPSHQFDGVFFLNALDHVRCPKETLDGVQRILTCDGLLFLFVDIDKSIDYLHPHRLTQSWLMMELAGMETLVVKNNQSWKHKNRVVYYVGRKIT